MNMLMNTVKRFKNDESGATAIEYGLIAALIAVVVIGAVAVLGENLSGAFDTISTAIEDPAAAAAAAGDGN